MAALLQTGSRIAASSARAVVSRSQSRLRTTLILFAALNAILLFVLLRAPGASEEDRRAEIARLQAEERMTREQVVRLRELRQKVQAATNNERQFIQENFLMRSAASSQMLEDLDRLAQENGLRSSGMNFTEQNMDASGPGWTSTTATLSVEGDYGNLVRFINDLEKSPLFWIVQSLNVSGQSGSQLRLDLQATTFLLPS